MVDNVITGLSEAVIVELEKRAAAHHCSLSDEAKSILSGVLAPKIDNDWSRVDAIFHRLSKSGRLFSDSATLIRESRDAPHSAF